MNKYLEAAKDILIRHGKPLHYKVIATAANRYGLIGAISNLEIRMSTELSKDSRDNSTTFFRKIRGGVYDVIFGINLSQNILGYNQINQRLSRISKEIDVRNNLYALKKAISAVSRLFDYSNDSGEVLVSNGNSQIQFKIDSFQANIGNFNSRPSPLFISVNTNATFIINKDIFFALNRIGNQIGIIRINSIIDYSLSIFEFLINFQISGIVDLHYNSGLRPFSIQKENNIVI